MTILVEQRCANHFTREAVAQCPSCNRFFCRECVTEHKGRMMCVACVASLARAERPAERSTRLRWILMAAFGVLISWLIFYYLGLMLARIPSEFHVAQIEAGAS